jgi:hypothetical protein
MTILFTFIIVPIAGQNNATIIEYSGKVEMRAPGGTWQSIEQGMQISQDVTLSTGFESTVTLELIEAQLRVQPLTRMTLEKILRQRETVTTEVNLQVGIVEAEVNTGEDVSHDFSVRSSVATAAVRGTEFVFDGNTVTTTEGTTQLTSQAGLSRSVAQGESSRTTTAGLPEQPSESKQQQASVKGYVSGTDEKTFLKKEPETTTEDTSQVTTTTITWE